jgi:hypothetical protein
MLRNVSQHLGLELIFRYSTSSVGEDMSRRDAYRILVEGP